MCRDDPLRARPTRRDRFSGSLSRPVLLAPAPFSPPYPLKRPTITGAIGGEWGRGGNEGLLRRRQLCPLSPAPVSSASLRLASAPLWAGPSPVETSPALAAPRLSTTTAKSLTSGGEGAGGLAASAIRGLASSVQIHFAAHPPTAEWNLPLERDPRLALILLCLRGLGLFPPLDSFCVPLCGMELHSGRGKVYCQGAR